MLKYLWPFPLLACGVLIAYMLWPSNAGWVAGMVCVLLLLPLCIVLLRDGLRARESNRFYPTPKPAILRRPLFTGTPLARLFDNVFTIHGAVEILQLLLTVGLGILVCGYIAFSWLQHWIHRGEFLSLGITALVSGFVIFMALVGIPAARLTLIGISALCGFAFVLGYQDLLLP